jgi:DNA gyrase subunit A
LLREAKKRAHVLEAMIYAVCDIDEVIRNSSAAADTRGGHRALMAGSPSASRGTRPRKLPMPRWRKEGAGQGGGGRDAGVALTRVQAEAIGSHAAHAARRARDRETGGRVRGVVAEIEGYERILADHQKVLGIIKTDCAEMQARYGLARRAHAVIEERRGPTSTSRALIRVEDVAVTISHEGYASACRCDTYRQQGRGGKGIRAGDAKDDDFIEHVFVASTHDDLLCFTDTGRVFKIKVFEVPEMSAQQGARDRQPDRVASRANARARTSRSRTSRGQQLPHLRQQGRHREAHGAQGLSQRQQAPASSPWA